MLFTCVLVLILSTLTLLTTAQIPTPTPTPTTLTPTSITDAQATKILNDLNAYVSLLLPDPEITAVVSLLATAVPASVMDRWRADPIGYLEFWLAGQTTTPSWVSATLPTPYQAYWLSVQSVEASIMAEDLRAAATTLTPTSITNAQATHILHDINAYLHSLAKHAEYTTMGNILATAAPAQRFIGNAAFVQYLLALTATPSWESAIPTPYRGYWSSVVSVQASIITRDLKGAAAPTMGAGVKVVGAAVAVGAAGMALL